MPNFYIRELYMIVLFLNGDLGLRLLNFAIERKTAEVILIVTNNSDKQGFEFKKQAYEVLSITNNVNIMIISWDEFKAFKFRNLHLKVGISAMFGHIIPQSIIENFRFGIFNLHPSLLPINRGANPIMWSILDNQPQGVTLHKVDNNIDTGPIVSQIELETSLDMNAHKIYELCMDALFDIFVSKWQDLINGKVSYSNQPVGLGNIHFAREIKVFERVTYDEKTTPGELIRRIQAFDHGKLRKLKYIDENNHEWELSINLKKCE